MNGGTYSEALKAGFSVKQAGMLARLGAETKSEAIQNTVNIIGERKSLNRNDFAAGFMYGLMGTFIVASLGGLLLWGRV